MNNILKLESLLESSDIKICIVGLGYVGLPLAVEFGKKYETVGFDINEARLDDLRNGIDSTLELNKEQIKKANRLSFSNDKQDIICADIYIVTVPTPIDKHKKPDLTPLIRASEMIGSVISDGNIVIYESTVYPGATEEDCIPIIESISGLSFNSNFYAGYSPERINPGDKEHTVTNILKVTSGSLPEIANLVDKLYKSIITAGTYKAPSIKVAEAAKVIENTQRDVNIGLINELSLIFNILEIDTEEVLKAAGTKWNFLNFRPGLVGGHCIGVDPYYLTHKAQSLGFNAEMILAGRRVNDSMGRNVASQLIKKMLFNEMPINKSKALVMGFAFKENCPDVRNTKVIDVIHELRSYGLSVDCFDPWVDPKEASVEYDLDLISKMSGVKYDAIIIAVAHDEFKEMGIDTIRSHATKDGLVFDLKYIFTANDTDLRI
jgi:UDP-N-acetyl-D-glucosamine/UDP-N-acetyl-D-galactosamine dehydrogenase